MGWKAFAQCGIYMVEYEMLENSSGYTDKYKICKSITYKEGIKKGGTQAMKILVTGGAGYIGSHTCVELLEAGYDVVIVDNLYNASEKAVDRIGQITGKTPTFYEADIRDYEKMTEIFAKEQPDTVIHFAGLKAVGESVRKPLEYYENNIAGTLNLCKVMRENGCKNILIFCNCVRQSSLYPYHRGMSKGRLYKPLWLDKAYVRADPDRYPVCRSRMECDPASLLQPNWCT